MGKPAWLGGTGDGLMFKVGDAAQALAYDETLRPGVVCATQDLSDAGYTLEVLSGDTDRKTARLADLAGIGIFRAAISPEQKQAHIAQLERQGRAPCMVGDGLNDTAALAAAHASISPGSALDAARSAADIVVIGDTMRDLPELFGVARKAVRLSRQNFGVALAYNAVAIPIAVLGHATPLAAALAMSLSSITVLLNAVRVGWVR